GKFLNKQTYKKALEHFKKCDKDFYDRIKLIKLEEIRPKKDMTPDAYLVRSIISQQISTKAAASILKKFLDLFPNQTLCHEYLTKLTDDQLRGVGLSRGKAIYIRDLSQRFVNGELPEYLQIKKMSDQEL